LACKADALGRKGHEDDTYPQADLFREAFLACRQIDNQAILATGVKGLEFKEALHKERMRVVKKISGNRPE
jgi:tRNA nucleotidyltransferase (CCA-adding enzyme)